MDRLLNHPELATELQLVVVVEILIAKCDPEHPLAYQGHHLMLDQLLSPHVAKAHSQA
jgi:hypothetical protein